MGTNVGFSLPPLQLARDHILAVLDLLWVPLHLAFHLLFQSLILLAKSLGMGRNSIQSGSSFWIQLTGA